MPDNFWLSEGQWAAIAPHLPMVHTGALRQDDRRIISGILHRLRAGCRWRAWPAEYGPYTTVFNRYDRWRSAACGRTFSPRRQAVPSRLR